MYKYIYIILMLFVSLVFFTVSVLASEFNTSAIAEEEISSEMNKNTGSNDTANADVLNGWVYGDDGLKYYYIDGVMQKDVRDLVEGPYNIYVNTQCNVITVYAEDGSKGYIIPVVSFLCGTGQDGATPIGTFEFTVQQRWHHFAKNWDTYVQYACSFWDGLWFHSISYLDQDVFTMQPLKYIQLGESTTHGCIRMLAGDMKWIYDNMENMNEVKNYDSPVPGPFGKPTRPIIGRSKYGYYDPTDPGALFRLQVMNNE